LARWETARKKQGRFELSDLIEMASLSDRQLPTLETILGVRGPFVPVNRDALRLVAALSPQQRQAAFAPEGTILPIMNDRQVALLQKVFGRKRIEPPVRVRLEQQPTGTAITFIDSLGESPSRWAYQGEEVRQQEQPPAPSLRQ